MKYIEDLFLYNDLKRVIEITGDLNQLEFNLPFTKDDYVFGDYVRYNYIISWAIRYEIY